MKVIILAGGLGTRLAEETSLRPKPMVEIGGKPILWHIMNIYAAHGFNEFIVACGYKGEYIKEYFQNFFIHANDYTIDLKDGSTKIMNTSDIDWKIAVVDTGLNTMTGGRILRLKDWIEDQPFMVTYGDGIGNVDIKALVAFHESHDKIATVTAVRPPARFGGLSMNDNLVTDFAEKPQTGEGWINGGFFVFTADFMNYLSDDNSVLERDPLETLVKHQQLCAFRHDGFWQPMDTLREKQMLESLWQRGTAPWKTW